MRFFARHWARIAVSFVPLLLALGHASGQPEITPGFAPGNEQTQAIAVDDRADVLAKRLAPSQLLGKIVLVGSTAPSLQDLLAFLLPSLTAARALVLNSAMLAAELATWDLALQAYRTQDWSQCGLYLAQLSGINPTNPLYPFYARRMALLRLHKLGPNWDGTSDFQS